MEQEDDNLNVEFDADALTSQILLLVAITSGASHAIGDMEYPLYITILGAAMLSTIALFYWMYKAIWPQLTSSRA